ncbi:non-hydrolyzing UDP-N-acetylglucosamine 2-epimerase [Bacillus sp. JJ1562]|uniref:non-hydrolyzing UDP-N-acetylglucosamine 2-epimerase n=1 Tax=Bacillus sp. JJ1562 TaxID=3122960 RepID=UPI0030038280
MKRKIKVMTIFGTRPEAIKMAPVIKELENHPHQITPIVTVTAQHRNMLDQVLDTFEIKPQYDLDIMQERQTLTSITSRALTGIDEILIKETPDLVLVHGDTTTTFAAGVAAFYNQIKVGHVEAGLRTYNKYSPFPEEMNRKMTTCIADFHFAPTEKAAQNLHAENIPESSIFITGNTGIDALKLTVTPSYQHPILNKIGTDKLLLLTAHRRENLGEPLKNIFKAIKRITQVHEDVQVVYPVHLNPAVKDAATTILGNNERIHLIDPLPVLDFHNFAARAHLILTDSGGIQEEAPSLGVPVLVLRDTTERPEGIEAGTLKLAGTDEHSIFSLAHELLTNPIEYEKMARASNPYGDGNGAKRIVEVILLNFQNTPDYSTV